VRLAQGRVGWNTTCVVNDVTCLKPLAFLGDSLNPNSQNDSTHTEVIYSLYDFIFFHVSSEAIYYIRSQQIKSLKLSKIKVDAADRSGSLLIRRRIDLHISVRTYMTVELKMRKLISYSKPLSLYNCVFSRRTPTFCLGENLIIIFI